MKAKLFYLKTYGILLIGFLFFNPSSIFSSNYTAVISGNWSNSATWGGTPPPYYIYSDQVVIPTGIDVTLDNSVTFSGIFSELNVEGTLSSASNTSLTFDNAAYVTGEGIIATENLMLGMASSLTFTGAIVTDYLICASFGNLPTTADVMVGTTLYLASGTSLSMETGGSLYLGLNGTIVISGGGLVLNGGAANLSGTYNVEYILESAIAGPELNGAGLNDISINVFSENNVMLTSDLTVSGTLSLESGTLILNSNDLNIEGDISMAGNGVIASTTASNISINANGTLSGALRFSSNGQTVNDFTVNIADNGIVMIGSDLIVNGNLYFISGKVDIDNNGIEIGLNGSISGASSLSYVITGSNGHLGMYLSPNATSATTFFVGTASYYAPANIQLNKFSPGRKIEVGVDADVRTDGTSGGDLSLTQPMVDATWFVQSDISAGLNMNLELVWPVAMEANGFNRSMAYISHHTSNNWDVSATAEATLQSNGMFSLKRNNITSLSPFAVFDENTSTSNIAEISSDGMMELFPNPASNFINVVNNSNFKEMYIDIIDIHGQMVGSHKITENNSIISLDHLSNGNYLIRFHNDQMNAIKKFSKI